MTQHAPANSTDAKLVSKCSHTTCDALTNRGDSALLGALFIDTLMMTTESGTKTVTHSRILFVRNRMGLHARPSAMIVRLANKYAKTDLRVRKDDEEVNGKSIMGLMMLAAGNGSKLTLTTIGPESNKMLDDLEGLFNRKFDET